MNRKSIGKLLICTTVFIFLFAAQALAAELVLINKTTKKIATAICYKDSTSGDWVVRGWFSVDPLGKRTVTFNTTNNIIYIHGTSGKSIWGCPSRSTSRKFNVVSDKFLYKKDRERPQGKNFRAASFCETRKTSNGDFRFTFND